MRLTAIKPVFNRKTKQYEIESHKGEGELISLVDRGFYVTDDLPRTLGFLTAGKLAWWNGLPAAKQEAVKAWLMVNV